MIKIRWPERESDGKNLQRSGLVKGTERPPKTPGKRLALVLAAKTRNEQTESSEKQQNPPMTARKTEDKSHSS